MRSAATPLGFRWMSPGDRMGHLVHTVRGRALHLPAVHAKPVFVDTSGRRGRLLRRGGLALGIALAGFLMVVGVGIVGGAATPLTPWAGDGGGSHSPAAVAPVAPTLLPKNSPRPATSSRAPHPRTSAKTSTPTASATTTPTRHGNAPATPPGQAKKTKNP